MAAEVEQTLPVLHLQGQRKKSYTLVQNEFVEFIGHESKVCLTAAAVLMISQIKKCVCHYRAVSTEPAVRHSSVHWSPWTTQRF